MKVFWSIIAVLLVAAVAVAFIPEKNDGPSLVVTSNSQTPGDEVITQRQPIAAADVVVNENANPVVGSESPAVATLDDGATDSPQLSNNLSSNDDDTNVDASLSEVTTATDDADDQTAVAGDSVTTDGTSNDAGNEQRDATDNAAESTTEIAAIPAATNLLNATVEEQPDGSLLIAGKYTVRGTGEFDDPYTLPWDLLVSLSSVYKPREGQKELPEFIMRMHDKQVKITGYIAFPMVAGEIEELLVMLNQWDGCCVGVPPTVYDSVEVRLVEAIRTTGASTTMPYGTVTGRMTIDPYFVNDWLVGLYLMEEAEIDIDF